MSEDEEAEKERGEDEANAGCFLHTLGFAGEGCLWTAIPWVVVFVWVLN